MQRGWVWASSPAAPAGGSGKPAPHIPTAFDFQRAPLIAIRTGIHMKHSGHCLWSDGERQFPLSAQGSTKGLRVPANNTEGEVVLQGAHNTDFLFLLTMSGL